MPDTILIAEDDDFLIKMLKLNIEQDLDAEVIIASDGEQAIKAIDKQKPDLLLLDLLMPKVDGFAVLEHCKKQKYSFSILVLSNLSQEIDQEKCKELGAVDYFVKSDMDVDDLVKKIQHYLPS